ncbi:helix-turn-helix domain-containing protein [Mesorhizobium sp. M1393]
MDERLRFVVDCLADEETMSELCVAYGISRKTGYKWLSRYRALGPEGLHDLPRAPSSAAAPRQPHPSARRPTAQGENCNPCIRFKVLPIYQLDNGRTMRGGADSDN